MDDAHDAETDQATPYVRLPWPLVAVGLLGLLAVVLAIGLFANRYLRPQVGLVPTPEAAAIAAAPQSTSTPMFEPTPTALTRTLATSTPLPVIEPTAVRPPQPVDHATPTAEPVQTVRPTVSPELAAEVSDAYQQYWQVRAEALYNLDASRLSQVMAGDHLAAVEERINQLGNEHQAIETVVDHKYAVVEVSAEEAKVADSYVDQSVYVDPQTHMRLSAPTGVTLNELYHMSKTDGTWRVVSLVRAP